MTDKAIIGLYETEGTIVQVEIVRLLSAYLDFFRLNGKISVEIPKAIRFAPDSTGIIYIYIDSVLVGFTNRIPVDDVFNSPRLGFGMLTQNKLFEEPTKKVDKNQLFYETYLAAPDRQGPVPVVTGLGITSFQVMNVELLEYVKRLAIIDEIEGEFSYIRDQNLHYNVKWTFGVVSDGLLTFRGCKTDEYSRIVQFVVERDLLRKEMIIKPLNNLDLGARVSLDDASLRAQGLSILINTIAYSFK